MDAKEHHACLNCGTELSSSYCPNCGQKASIHRYSIKHLIAHDFVHGVFHFDKGFLYTLKELFTRPGHSVREFIQGKRSKHFNIFTFLVLILTASHFLGAYNSFELSELYDNENSKSFMTTYQNFSRENPKLIAFMLIPIYALCSFLIFRRSKQNFTEHIVLNAFKASGEFIIGLTFTTLAIFYQSKEVLITALGIVSLLNFLYTVWFYRQYFSVFGYTKGKLIFRSILCAIAPQFVGGIIGGVIGIVTAAVK